MEFRYGCTRRQVTAGVIGTRKLSYDIWGDSVNIASRLQTQGLPNTVHVSQTVFERLKGRFEFKECGEIDLRGCGPAHTYLLLRPA